MGGGLGEGGGGRQKRCASNRISASCVSDHDLGKGDVKYVLQNSIYHDLHQSTHPHPV